MRENELWFWSVAVVYSTWLFDKCSFWSCGRFITGFLRWRGLSCFRGDVCLLRLSAKTLWVLGLLLSSLLKPPWFLFPVSCTCIFAPSIPVPAIDRFLSFLPDVLTEGCAVLTCPLVPVPPVNVLATRLQWDCPFRSLTQSFDAISFWWCFQKECQRGASLPFFLMCLRKSTVGAALLKPEMVPMRTLPVSEQEGWLPGEPAHQHGAASSHWISCYAFPFLHLFCCKWGGHFYRSWWDWCSL